MLSCFQELKSSRPISDRKRRIHEQIDATADQRDAWIERNAYFFREDWQYLRFLVPENKRILDLGCGTGALLAALKPSTGVGVDLNLRMIDIARGRYPQFTFFSGDVERLDEIEGLKGPFDFIIMSDTIGSLDDCLDTFRSLLRYCTPHTRIIVAYHTPAWEPLGHGYTWYGSGKQPSAQNWLSTDDIANLFDLAGFDVIKREWRILSPFRLFGLGPLINRYVATLPVVRKMCLRNYVIARPAPPPSETRPSASVIIPCRNERGNIESAVQRMPRFSPDLEIIFVEGGSEDGTWEEVQRVKATHQDLDIKAFRQTGRGKGDAVRTGFAQARGDFLLILDADLTMPPEDLPKFYYAAVSGKGEFINGSRLVYPMERQAMRFLNLLANFIFAKLFTYLLNQRFTDTLCGTKALWRRDYDEIVANRAYFGEFDPFGDFDLIFGASKLNLKVAEVPIRYAAREYGETQISRFRHGWQLLRMVVFAFRKLKAV